MAQVNFRVDDRIKKRAEVACSAMGLNMTTAINIFLTKLANEQRIPFEISAPSPNAETIEAIEEVREMKANPSLGKTYDNVDEMMRDLLDV